MSLIFSPIVIFIIALIIGALLGWFLTHQSNQNLRTEHIKKTTLLHKAQEENHNLETTKNNLQNKLLEAEKALSALTAENKSFQDVKTQFMAQFKNLSQEILEDKSKQFQLSAEKNLSHLLNPLKENIKSFQQKVEETYSQESRERFALKDNIKNLCEVHNKLEAETLNLSQALKGDIKAQGKWGEMILNAVLAASGLKENEHYTTQGKSFNLKDEEGKKQKPDVVVKLPDNKHIIIDAKVSLKHYEQCISAKSEDDKNHYIQQFKTSLRAHVKSLSEKKYQLGANLNTPDFVLMFFPIEGAFSLAMQSDPKLFQFSWENTIVIVSPTTLLATLKTVASIWKREKQNKNAREIAKASGRLYDKFTLFINDMSQIGSYLEKAAKSHTEAFQKLHTGHGNIISKLEHIKQLGARASKQIPENLLPSAEEKNNLSAKTAE